MAQFAGATAGVPLLDLPLTEDERARARRIDFSTDREADLPVGLQLTWRIRGMVALGALRPGDRLPSVRELAGFSGVNVNTARAVYSSLEDDGLLRSEQGRGTFVTDAAGGLRRLAEIVTAALAEAGKAGLDASDLLAAIYSAMSVSAAKLPPDPFPAPDHSGSPATLRRELRAQIARLEGELSAYAWDDPHRPLPTGPATAQPVGRVADVETLERVRGELIERLTRLRGEAERRGRSQQGARRHVTEMIADPASHPWEVVTSEDTGRTTGRDWRVVPRFGPLGAIMGWWRVKATKPGAGAAGDPHHG